MERATPSCGMVRNDIFYRRCTEKGKARPGRNPGRAVLLAIWRKVCYSVYGATSTTVGGSPRFYGGDTSLPPIAREGVMVMVTWEGLFQFCMVIATVIALVIQAYNDKK